MNICTWHNGICLTEDAIAFDIVMLGAKELDPVVPEINPNYSAPISHLLSQILDVAGQRRFAPWPPANFNREYACKQSIHVEMWPVLNRYN